MITCAACHKDKHRKAFTKVNGDTCTYCASEKRREGLTPPRVYVNTTTQGIYQPPTWTCRAGSERALTIKSRGIGA